MKERDQESSDQYNDQPSAFSIAWSNIIISIRKPILKVLLTVSGCAARNPATCVTSTILFCIAILTIGIFTNFSVDVSQDTLWTPTPSRVLSHGSWVFDSDFPVPPKWVQLLVHAEGKNVLGNEGLKRVFTAIDTVRNLPDYNKICDQASLTMPKLSSSFDAMDSNNTNSTCYINSPTRFWNNSVNEYTSENLNDQDTIQRLSMMYFSDGTAVDPVSIFGNSKRGRRDDENTEILSSVQLLMVQIALPQISVADEFETVIIEKMLNVRKQWNAESGNIYKLEVFTSRSLNDEFNRAIVKDIPLVPIVFIVMSIFTCLIFFRCDWLFSRSLLGLGAIVSVC